MDNNRILEKVKMKIAISSVKREDIDMNKDRLTIGKRIGIAACIVFSMTGVVFATNYDKIMNYFGLGNGIDTAVKNGYIEEPNMNHISSESVLQDDKNSNILNDLKTNIKIDSFLMDDLNLSVNFDIEFDEKINENINFDNISNIELVDLIVTDEENRIIFSKATKDVFDEYCKKNNLSYVFGEYNENYMNNGLNSFILDSDPTANKIKLNYNMYADGYPKSKKLTFNFGKILIEETKENETVKTTVLTGNWNINVDVPENMYNRQTISYKVVNCSNKDFNITTAFATDTGFEIGIIIDNMEKPENYLQVLNEDIQKEINEGKITKSEIDERRNTLLKTEKYQKLLNQYYPIGDAPYIENEEGEKFEKSSSPSRRQNNNFIYGDKFSYYETFELTKYEITSKLKVEIMFKGEPVIIELERK